MNKKINIHDLLFTVLGGGTFLFIIIYSLFPGVLTPNKPEINFTQALIECSQGNEPECNSYTQQILNSNDDEALVKINILLDQYYKSTKKVLIMDSD